MRALHSHRRSPRAFGLRLLERALDVVIFRWSEWKEFRGIRIGLYLVDAKPALSEHCRKKVEAALELVAVTSPRRFAHLTRDVRQIWVGAIAGHAIGRWNADAATCALHHPWVIDESTQIHEVAGTIVHEAMHARLARLGVANPGAGRCERACWRAELSFVRRLGGQGAYAETLEGVIGAEDFHPTREENSQASKRRIREILQAGGLPSWVERRFLDWLER